MSLLQQYHTMGLCHQPTLLAKMSICSARAIVITWNPSFIRRPFVVVSGSVSVVNNLLKLGFLLNNRTLKNNRDNFFCINLYQLCSRNLLLCRVLVDMTTKRNNFNDIFKPICILKFLYLTWSIVQWTFTTFVQTISFWSRDSQGFQKK